MNEWRNVKTTKRVKDTKKAYIMSFFFWRIFWVIFACSLCGFYHTLQQFLLFLFYVCVCVCVCVCLCVCVIFWACKCRSCHYTFFNSLIDVFFLGFFSVFMLCLLFKNSLCFLNIIFIFIIHFFVCLSVIYIKPTIVLCLCMSDFSSAFTK